MDIIVRTKTFKIEFVNNYVRKLYDNLQNIIIDLSKLPDEAKDLSEEENIDHSELKRKVNLLDNKRRSMTKEIGEIREKIIVELLESNDYEYDQKWWDRKTDADDLNHFMLTCIRKDIKEGSGKKK